MGGLQYWSKEGWLRERGDKRRRRGDGAREEKVRGREEFREEVELRVLPRMREEEREEEGDTLRRDICKKRRMRKAR